MAKSVNVPATKNELKTNIASPQGSAVAVKATSSAVAILPTEKTIAAFAKTGPMILDAYFAGDKLEWEAQKLITQSEARKLEASSRMVKGMLDIFTAEPRARDIAAKSFIGGKVEMPVALDYFKACFGYLKVFKAADGSTSTETTEAWNKRFHAPKNASAADEAKATERRNNYSTFMRLCMQRAIALSDLKEVDEVTFDENSKALAITGKGAEKTYGQGTVVLNKRDGKDKPLVEGKKVASLEALRKAAVEKYSKPGKGAGGRGKEEGSGVDLNTKNTQTVSHGDIQKDVQSACNSLLTFVNKMVDTIKVPDEVTQRLLHNVYTAIRPLVVMLNPNPRATDKVRAEQNAKHPEKDETKTDVAGTKTVKGNITLAQSAAEKVNTANAKQRRAMRRGVARQGK